MIQINGLENYSETGILTDIGLAFEKYCVDLLKANGFTNVERTQSTRDYGVDIVAKRNGNTYGIQCKYSSGTIGIKAVQEALAGKEYYSCNKGVILTNTIFNSNAIEYAHKLGIELWDENELKALQDTTYNTKDIYDFYILPDTGRILLTTDEDFLTIVEWLEPKVYFAKKEMQELMSELSQYNAHYNKSVNGFITEIEEIIESYNTTKKEIGERYPFRLFDTEKKVISNYAKSLINIRCSVARINQEWEYVQNAFSSLYVLESMIDSGTIENAIYVREIVYDFMRKEEIFISTITNLLEKVREVEFPDWV